MATTKCSHWKNRCKLWDGQGRRLTVNINTELGVTIIKCMKMERELYDKNAMHRPRRTGRGRNDARFEMYNATFNAFNNYLICLRKRCEKIGLDPDAVINGPGLVIPISKRTVSANRAKGLTDEPRPEPWRPGRAHVDRFGSSPDQCPV